MTDRKDNWPNLVAGSTVIYADAAGLESIVKVDRFTNTQILLTRTSARFNRKTGRMVGGGGWNRSHMYPATAEDVVRVRAANQRRRYLHRVRNLDWGSLKPELLERVIAVLNEESK